MAVWEITQRRLFVVICVVALFGVVTFALAAATLGTLNNRLNSVISTATTSKPRINSVLAETIRIDDLMNHLRQLQRIADESNGNRAINTRGFNATVKYIYDYLTNQITGLKVMREIFHIRNFALATNPFLSSLINGTIKNYTYSSVLPRSEFTYVNYSTSANFSNYVPVVNIPNFGCALHEWQNVSGFVALVKGGGTCTYAEKGILAANSGIEALLFYNNGETSSSLAPTIVRLRYTNQLPALFLSYTAGQSLANAVASTGATIKLEIQLQDLESFPVDNICADTIDGDPTQTIVVGSHSDSVPAGPGINDNGKYLLFSIERSRCLC
jgi:hypothetical protein